MFSLKFVNEGHCIYYKRKKGGKDQESIQSSTTPDYMGKLQNTNKHHKREPRGQPFPSIQWTNCHKVKVLNGAKLCINSLLIALLVHKIVLIGTWMLKARSTDFIQKYK